MAELRLVVRMIPPSANHYKAFRVVTPRRGKPFAQWYLTEEAKAWFAMVAAVAQGRKIRGTEYELSVVVFMADGRPRDADNFLKTICDALEHCGAIDNDKRITDLHMHRRMDAVDPRTVIIVRTDQEQMFA